MSRIHDAVKRENLKYRQKVQVDPFMRRKTQPLMGNTQACLEAMDHKYKTDIDMSYEQKTFMESYRNEKIEKSDLLIFADLLTFCSEKETKQKAEEEEKRKKQFNLNQGEHSMENAHDFDIGDILSDITTPQQPIITKPSIINKSRKNMNLAEYKRSKGLIWV